MAIYHLHAKIIGRSHGRTITAKSAYTSGRRISVRSIVGSAAYRAGDILSDERHNLTHDFTSKSGIVYSNILLPENAPSEFQNREILWNAVEQKEIRKDAQLAREVEVSIPREFDFDEQINVVENFVNKNFTNRGMCADLSIHDKDDGNPHAHILLTVRDVSENGFENKVKSREWNKVSALKEWRENWANGCNERLIEKGVEKIDHRSFEEQGIDRNPTVHLGHEAHALEKQGIKTLVGDMNREIIKSNLTKIKNEYINISKEIEDADGAHDIHDLREQQRAIKYEYQKLKFNADKYYFFESYEIKSSLEQASSSSQMSEHDLNTISINVREKIAGQQKKLIPSLAHGHDRVLAVRDEAQVTENTAQNMHEIKERVITLDSKISELSRKKSSVEQEARVARHQSEKIAERADHIRNLDNRVAELIAKRQNMGRGANTKEIDRQISQSERTKQQAENMFVREYKIAPEQARAEVVRLENKAWESEHLGTELDEKIAPLIIERDKFELEYKRQNMLIDTHLSGAKIRDKLTEFGNKTRAKLSSVGDIITRNETERRLNRATAQDYDKILQKSRPEHREILTKQRESEKIQQRTHARDFVR
ncbi:MAG: MobA/MobL family protein [Treponema sp.]|nr:MobA/MobL family protein [Treponema sp.]